VTEQAQQQSETVLDMAREAASPSEDDRQSVRNGDSRNASRLPRSGCRHHGRRTRCGCGNQRVGRHSEYGPGGAGNALLDFAGVWGNPHGGDDVGIRCQGARIRPGGVHVFQCPAHARFARTVQARPTSAALVPRKRKSPRRLFAHRQVHPPAPSRCLQEEACPRSSSAGRYAMDGRGGSSAPRRTGRQLR